MDKLPEDTFLMITSDPFTGKARLVALHRWGPRLYTMEIVCEIETDLLTF